MSFISIVHGRIIPGISLKENREFIYSLDKQQTFPWIMPEMFGFQDLDIPYYFDRQPIIFGATYKQVEDDWTSWLIRFEHILENLDFDTAKIQLETEIYGTFHYFWKSRKYDSGNYGEQSLREMQLKAEALWYYGYGLRDIWGIPETGSCDNSESKLAAETIHPFIITAELTALFEELKSALQAGEKYYFYDLPGYFLTKENLLYPLLTRLSLEKKIIFSLDPSAKDSINSKSGPYIILKG